MPYHSTLTRTDKAVMLYKNIQAVERQLDRMNTELANNTSRLNEGEFADFVARTSPNLPQAQLIPIGRKIRGC